MKTRLALKRTEEERRGEERRGGERKEIPKLRSGAFSKSTRSPVR